MSASTSELKLEPCRSPYYECEPGKCTRPGFRDARHEAVESADEEDRLRALFEATAKDSFNFRRSRRGTYVNPAIARDWKWFYLGATKGNVLTQRPAAQKVDAIAGIIERRLWAMPKPDPQVAYEDLERAILALRQQAESDARRAAQEQLYTERERHTAEVKRLQAEIGRLQSLSPQAVPMTGAEVSEAHVKAPYTSNDSFYSIFSCGIRAAEAHHGITAPAGGEG